MASVNDRGQVLLLGAIVVAVTFVTLSVVLSGTLYSATITKTAVADAGSDHTRSVLLDVRDDGATALQSAVERHPADERAQENAIRATVAALDDYYRRYYAQRDAAVRIDVDGVDTGDYVSQSSGSFAYDGDSDGVRETTDWSITDGQQRVRDMSVTVRGGTGQTRLVFDDGTEQYTITLGANGRVEVDWPGTGTTVCQSSGSRPVEVDISESSVDGTHCGALAFGSALDSTYDIRVEDGDAIDGSYRLTTERNARGTTTTQRVYAVDIAVSYRTAAVDYDGTVSTAPGEIG